MVTLGAGDDCQLMFCRNKYLLDESNCFTKFPFTKVLFPLRHDSGPDAKGGTQVTLYNMYITGCSGPN